MNKGKLFFVNCFLLIVFLLITHPPAGGSFITIYAQTQPFDVTTTYQVFDKDAVDGDILITSDKGFIRADVPHSIGIFGVLQKKPIVVYQKIDDPNGPIARVGVAQVNVTTINGPIKLGDYITSSKIAGKGQRGNQSGYVIGTALGEFSNSNSKITSEGQQVSVGQVPVALRIEYVDLTNTRSFGRVFDSLNSALFATAKNPQQLVQLIKFLIAGLIFLASVAIGFFTFARSVPKSIEAIGRNPLAKNTIQFSIILNIIFTVVTTLIGIAAAIIIIKI